MVQPIKVPDIGEKVESGVVVVVHIKVGDTVVVDDTVIELETDKALVEIPSPFAGRITDVLAKVGAHMKVGDAIARIEIEAADPSTGLKPSVVDGDGRMNEPEGGEAEAASDAKDQPQPDPSDIPITRTMVPASPSIRRLAWELGIDLYSVDGSGPGGRISEADVKGHGRQQQTDASKPAQCSSPSDANHWGDVDIQEMDTVRRLTAQSTSASWTTIPHVTQFDEADITGVMSFIEKKSHECQQLGVKLNLTAIITWICAQGLKRFPRFNASIDVSKNRITLKRYVNIGIATDTPRGLLVPVIRDADLKSLLTIAESIDLLSAKARNKKIRSDEMDGGTFTISNQGGIGGTGFTPLVLWPQVAILGVSRYGIKPVYIGDQFEPRTILPLSLSYDHRNIDGADAARFLRWICEALEQPLNLFID
ncbi:AceF: dihydrolipoamide acyltransferase (E2 component of 2-oxoglutarate dehydrogenase complex) [Desulfosarcina variabilis str. Montpellier]|uniref:2-oxo acid dehydrogenase subunit E2 n=1 Tax=Desulfosarcina variabilis TaxID=2300 RepID=UPI003AFA62A6